MTQHEQPWDYDLTGNSEQKSVQKENSPEPTDDSCSDTASVCPFTPAVNSQDQGSCLSTNAELSQEFAYEHIVRQLGRFNCTYVEIFSKDSSSARSLFPFIRGRLLQYSLEQQYDEVAILQEVYIRTIKKILEGREITNHYGWIRSVAHKYIQELSRTHRRTIHSDIELLEYKMLSGGIDEEHLTDEMLKNNIGTKLLGFEILFDGIDEEHLTDEMLKIRRAFQELSSEEQLLLSLKAVQDLSWAEIQQIWIHRGYGNPSLEALRKRKERALSHLRTIYHSL